MKKNKLNFIVSVVLAFFLGWLFNSGLSSTETITLFGSELEVFSINKPFQITNTVIEFLMLLLSTLGIYYGILRSKYEKSKKSIKFISKIFINILHIEVVIFSFIFGTNLNNIIKIENYISNKALIILGIGVLSILIFIQLYLDYNIEDTIVEEDTNKNEIFESRKKDFPILNGFLKINKGTSIIGKWGSGKTFFIKYFLEKSQFKDDYEYIYIDTSLFLENKSLINNINIQLDDIFIRNKIIPQKNLIIESLFYQPEGWLKSIFKYFFQKESYLDEKKEISVKIKELGKKVVIVLDNLERLESKEKIQNMLSIVEEVLPIRIPRIYLYDLEKLKKLFEKENNTVEVEEYFEKYTDFIVTLSEIDDEEIIKEFKFSEDVKKVYKETIEKLNNLLDEFLYKRDQEKENIEIIEKIKSIEEIILLLKNPRLVKQCHAIIKNEKIDYDKKIKFYFAILTVIFSKKININQEILNKNNKTPIKNIENINERIIFEIMFNTGSVVDNRDNFGYIKDLLDKKWEKDLSISKKMIKNIEDEIKDSCLKTKVLKISILLTYIGNLTRLEKDSSVIKKKIEQLFDNEAKDTIFIIESSVDTDSNEFYNYVLELDDEYLKNIQMIEKVEVSINYKKETIVGNKYKDWILDQYFLNRFKEMRKLFFSQVDVKIYKYICFTGLIILIATKKNIESSSNNVIEMIDEIEKSDLIKKIDSVGDFFEHLKNIDATFIEGINSNLLDNEFKKYDKIKSLKTTKEVLNEETINVNKNIINLKNYLKNYIGSKIFLNFKEGNLNTLRIVSDSDIRKDKLNITFTTDDISKIVENWVPDNSNESDARDLILIELNKKRKKKEDKYS
ncbi:MAG: P-loop NTPase fold protein [Cetobacterium sp.]